MRGQSDRLCRYPGVPDPVNIALTVEAANGTTRRLVVQLAYKTTATALPIDTLINATLP